MRTVRKYACHRLYDGPDHYLSQSVVSVDKDGRVLTYALLTEETSSTEWIGGIVFFSDTMVPQTRELNELLQTSKSLSKVNTLYAWHISHVDFENFCITPQSMIQKLNADTIISL